MDFAEENNLVIVDEVAHNEVLEVKDGDDSPEDLTCEDLLVCPLEGGLVNAEE